MSKQKYLISKAAQQADCPPDYLRILEKRGIISPERVGNIRIFGDEDIETARAYREQNSASK